MTEYVAIDGTKDHKVEEYLCWPVYDQQVVSERISQLQSLGVEKVALGGPHVILGYPILGKGHVGIVLMAVWKGVEVALKARRTDADRDSMEKEAKFLEIANNAGVGPRLHAWSNDFIVMERLVGPYFREWVSSYTGNSEEFRRVARILLEKVRNLDKAGLDHGELTKVKRHFIVTEGGPRIIDFESASVTRRTQNVTATVQSMFLNHRFARILNKIIPIPDRGLLIEVLTSYKNDQSDMNFERILDICGLV
ncbi:MAG: serine/threonine protein kinase [Candidatus Bathyarchaeota archaeon]|nr:serine/threonine protein kinase [Candidatus Bathyarchaeota archaeon]